MSRGLDAERIGHMVAAARNILRVARSPSSLRDETRQAATLRWFEVMGEAAKGVGDATRRKAPDIPWQAIMAFRNVLIHGYDDVDLRRVWEAVVKTKDLAERLQALQDRLNET